MKTIKISEIIDNAKNGAIPSVKLLDASRYAANVEGEMIVNTDLFYSGRVYAYMPDDELIKFGKKTLNVSELRRILEKFIGKGEVRISTKDKMYEGEIEE